MFLLSSVNKTLVDAVRIAGPVFTLFSNDLIWVCPLTKIHVVRIFRGLTSLPSNKPENVLSEH